MQLIVMWMRWFELIGVNELRLKCSPYVFACFPLFFVISLMWFSKLLCSCSCYWSFCCCWSPQKVDGFGLFSVTWNPRECQLKKCQYSYGAFTSADTIWHAWPGRLFIYWFCVDSCKTHACNRASLVPLSWEFKISLLRKDFQGLFFFFIVEESNSALGSNNMIRKWSASIFL